MALKPNAKLVFDCVKSHEGENITAPDIAEETGLEVKSVNGIITAAFQRKGLMKRVPAEVELADGSHKAVKLIRLTEAGKVFDPDAAEE